MKNTPANSSAKINALGLAIGLGLLPVLAMTGCTSPGDRYNQSTGEKIDDHSLSSAVKSALKDDKQYKYEDVNVVTFKGVVQLNGFVNIRDQKTRAGDIAKKVVGVTEVQNNITIKE